jgi:hypothetical protein
MKGLGNLESRKKRRKRALMKVIKGIIQALKDSITGLLQSMLLVGAVLAGTDFEIFLHLSYKERERERERESRFNFLIITLLLFSYLPCSWDPLGSLLIMVAILIYTSVVWLFQFIKNHWFQFKH